MGQALTKKNKKGKSLKYETSEEDFIRNGSILLEKRIALSQGEHIHGAAEEIKIFSAEDIESATNYNEPDCILWSNLCGIFYKGILNGRFVSIWASWQLAEENSKRTDRILTEVATRMVMKHNSMVKLYGCCLETCIPILVYEFLPNQSLYDHLHGGFASTRSLKWVQLLKIAADVSYALSYMHNALSRQVVHRALQSNIVLLDESFHAKLGNFGFAIIIKPGEVFQRTSVEGIPGYIDPEYIETQIVTDKCDVYSFGVLMLELLTRKDPFAMAQSGMDLVNEFAPAVERNCVMDIIDHEIAEQASSAEIEPVVQLAINCVESEGARRPTMIEVVSKLWEIQEKYK